MVGAQAEYGRPLRHLRGRLPAGLLVLPLLGCLNERSRRRPYKLAKASE
jgi:hypothetical protein